MTNAQRNEKINEFLEEIIGVYKKHGLSLAHEDGHGAFAVEKLSERNVKWLLDALDWSEK